MDDHLQSLQSSALTATRHAATLPTDLPFYRSVDPRVSQQIDSISSRVLHLTHQLLQLSSSLNPNLPVHPKETLQDPDCLMFHFHSSVVDVMDHLFERTVSSPSSVERETHTPHLRFKRIPAWTKPWVVTRPLPSPSTKIQHQIPA